MSQDNVEHNYSSDDDIFFGPLTLDEIKKTLFPHKKRQTIANVDASSDENKSFKIIETHSSPDIMTGIEPLVPVLTKTLSSSNNIVSRCAVEDSDDSFLLIEKLVTDLCVSSKTENDEELNNTLDVVEFILNNGPKHEDQTEVLQHNLSESTILKNNVDSVFQDDKIHNDMHPIGNTLSVVNSEVVQPKHTITPSKNEIKLQSCVYLTPSIANSKLDNFKTPKTPGKTVSHKKLKQSVTPLKNQYQHIVSPVASYIKNSPVVPLMKNIRPIKPLPGASFIPQRVKASSKVKADKENVVLPSTVYKCAKETRLIDVPDDKKLPTSQWVQQMASSIPRGLVTKHIHRVTSSAKRPLNQQQEDSFNDLTLHQADLSVCTQKNSYNYPRKQY